MFINNGADFKYTWPALITVAGEEWDHQELSREITSSDILYRKKQKQKLENRKLKRESICKNLQDPKYQM